MSDLRRVGTYLRWPLYTDASAEDVDANLHLVAVAACKAISEADNTDGYGDLHGGRLEHSSERGTVTAIIGDRSFAATLGDFSGGVIAAGHVPSDRAGFEGTLLYEFFNFAEAA